MSSYLETLYLARKLKKLEKSPHPKPKNEAQDAYPNCDADRAAAQCQLEAIKWWISVIEKQRVKVADRPGYDHSTRILRYFDPSVQDRISQILAEFDKTRAWLEKEEWDTSVVDASMLNEEERTEIVKKSYDCRARYITRTVMPEDEYLERVYRHNYGVNIDDILPYYKQESHKSVEDAFFKHSPSWDDYRADGLLNSHEPDSIRAVRDVYMAGRQHLIECLDNLIYRKHIPDIEDSTTGGRGLLKKGQYTKRDREFWWIQAKRYQAVLSSLVDQYRVVWEFVHHRRPRRAGGARSTMMEPSSTAREQVTVFPGSQGIKRSLEDNSKQSHKRQKQRESGACASETLASKNMAVSPERFPGRDEGTGKEEWINNPEREQSAGDIAHPNPILRNKKTLNFSPRRSTRIAARRQRTLNPATHSSTCGERRIAQQIPTPPSSPDSRHNKVDPETNTTSQSISKA